MLTPLAKADQKVGWILNQMKLMKTTRFILKISLKVKLFITTMNWTKLICRRYSLRTSKSNSKSTKTCFKHKKRKN